VSMRVTLKAASIGLLVTAIVAAGGVANASESTDSSSELETISSVSEGFQDDLVAPDQVTIEEDAVSTEAAGTDVIVPLDATSEVLVTGDQTLAITIPSEEPGAPAVRDGEVLDSSAVSFDSGEFSTVVAPLDSGAVQFLSVISSEDAPREYRYSFGTDGGVSMNLQPDGSVAISDSAGVPTGGIAAPWAYDANGTPVPTWYEIDGSDLIQHVAHVGAGFAYPIVADPTLTWQGWGYSIKYTRLETLRVSQAASDAAALAVLCGIIASAPGAVACGLGGLIVTRVSSSYVRGIYNRGNCLQQNSTLGWGTYYYEVRC
jgi:hypothetical protein